MNYSVISKNGKTAAVVDPGETIGSASDILDLMVSAQYNHHCVGLIVSKESLGEAFFDLKTGIAGEILQKFSNYHMKLAIIGDFSQYKSRSLRDFIYECNNGSCVFFKDSKEAGLDAF